MMYFTLFLCNSSCGSWQLEVVLPLIDWLLTATTCSQMTTTTF